MGCAPSIHVSQSGIVIREEIRESSSPRPIVSSPSEIVGHIRSSSDSGSHISTSSSSRYRGSYKRSYYSARGSSIEAETQTQDLSMTENIKVEKVSLFCYGSYGSKISSNSIHVSITHSNTPFCCFSPHTFTSVIFPERQTTGNHVGTYETIPASSAGKSSLSLQIKA